MLKTKITGFTSYKGVMLQQHDDYQTPFSKLLLKIKPSRILEIGTGAGGFTLFLRDKLNEIGLNETIIRSYDINDTQFDIVNLELHKEILYDVTGNLNRFNIVEPFLKSDGVSLVLCDGGNKSFEFNQLSVLLKTGDIIMAHDYVDTYENFKNIFYDKIWNWCEINENDIKNVCENENLIDFMKEDFNKIVWVCKIKI